MCPSPSRRVSPFWQGARPICRHLWTGPGDGHEEEREGLSLAHTPGTHTGLSGHTCGPRAHLGTGRATQLTWDHPGLGYGAAPGTLAGEIPGKETGLGQHGLLVPAHGRRRPLAQVVGRQPSQAPEKPEAQPWLGGGVFPRQCHLMLGNHAVTAAGAPPPPTLNVSGFEDQGVCACQRVCL